MNPVVSNTQTVTVHPAGVGPVEITVTEQSRTPGHGHPVLLLHGGAGPQSVAAFAEALAGRHDARVITPIHPGFAGTPRPERLDSIAALGGVYAHLLAEWGLADVTVVGNSIGGWTAVEAALAGDGFAGGSPVGRLVVVDAVGLALVDHPIVDFFTLTMDEITDRSYYRPDAYRIDVTALPEAVQEVVAGNRASLAAYGGATMADLTLLGRLPQITVPTHVVWGAADRIVPVEHGRAYADAIPGAQLTVLDNAGHLPQIEMTDELVELVWAHADRPATPRPA